MGNYIVEQAMNVPYTFFMKHDWGHSFILGKGNYLSFYLFMIYDYQSQDNFYVYLKSV